MLGLKMTIIELKSPQVQKFSKNFKAKLTSYRIIMPIKG